MFGLSINLHQWNHLIAKLILIVLLTILQQSRYCMARMSQKACIGRILEKILDYTFRLYYVKGKDLILADDLTMFGMTMR